MARARKTREERARENARLRQENGDHRPFMVILKQERDRLGIILPVDKTRKRVVEDVWSPLL